MKKIILLLLLFAGSYAANAQRDCTKKMRKLAGKMTRHYCIRDQQELQAALLIC